MATNEEITRQIVDAWDEIQAEEKGEPASTVEPEPEPEPELEPYEDDEELEPEEDEPEEEEEEEEPEDDDEAAEAEETAESFDTDDVEVRAFLAKYNGNLDDALKGAAELYRLIGRQGAEKGELEREVDALRDQLRRVHVFGANGEQFDNEQLAWVEEAVQSGHVPAYVQRAVDEGQFELARAVCREWARDDPYNATRLGGEVDAIEYQIATYQPPIDHGRLLEEMQKQFPDMAVYDQSMTSLLTTLPANHPAVADVRSGDINAVARGLYHLYDLARASSTTVRSTREKVREQQRQNGASARSRAQVSSSSTSPSTVETPRQGTQILPGLTWEALSEELERASQE
jgi:hypothetical protein